MHKTATKLAYIQAHDRFQLTVSSLEDRIEKDNPVRCIDAFVDQLDLCQSGYLVLEAKTDYKHQEPAP